MVSDYRTIYLSDAYRPETFDIHIISVYVCVRRPGLEPGTHTLKVYCANQLCQRRVILFVNQYVKELNT